MKLRTAGIDGELFSDGDKGFSQCGSIKNGVVFYFKGIREISGAWVVDFISLEKLYLAAKKFKQPKREGEGGK